MLSKGISLTAGKGLSKGIPLNAKLPASLQVANQPKPKAIPDPNRVITTPVGGYNPEQVAMKKSSLAKKIV